MDNQFHDSRQARSKSAEANSPATEAQMQGTRSLLWLLAVLVVCIMIVLAMWGRFSGNKTSIESDGGGTHSQQSEPARSSPAQPQ